MRRLASVAAAGFLAACAQGSTPPQNALTVPTAPTPTTVYAGTITDSVGGSGSVTISLQSSGSIIGGTWTAAFPEQKTWTRVVTGTVNGSSVTATAADCVESDTSTCFPDCRQVFTGTLTATAITGSYVEVPGDSCAPPRSGTVNAVKQ